MADLNIRKVDASLLRAINLAAVQADLTQRDWVIKVLTEVTSENGGHSANDGGGVHQAHVGGLRSGTEMEKVSVADEAPLAAMVKPERWLADTAENHLQGDMPGLPNYQPENPMVPIHRRMKGNRDEQSGAQHVREVGRCIPSLPDAAEGGDAGNQEHGLEGTGVATGLPIQATVRCDPLVSGAGRCNLHACQMVDFVTKWICEGPPAHTVAKGIAKKGTLNAQS